MHAEEQEEMSSRERAQMQDENRVLRADNMQLAQVSRESTASIEISGLYFIHRFTFYSALGRYPPELRCMSNSTYRR